MDELLSYINQSWFIKLFVSVTWVIAVLLLRLIVLRAIGKFDIKSLDLRRRWVLQIRSLSYFFAIGGLFVLWATEIRSFAVTLVAILVALVIALKEVILCFTGSFFKASTASFSLGDRIEIDGVRGDVVDQNLLGTTILEVGPTRHSQQYTGRAVVIPNSKFLAGSLINESYLECYKINSITVPMKLNDDWDVAEKLLLQATNDFADKYVEGARQSFLKLQQREGISPPRVEPRVILSLPEPDRIDLIARFAVPPKDEAVVVQNILHRYLELVRDKLHGNSREMLPAGEAIQEIEETAVEERKLTQNPRRG